MEKVENAALPKIEIFCCDPESKYLAYAVGYGIEEEGLPYRIAFGEYSLDQIYEVSQGAGLGAAVLVQNGIIFVFARQLKEKKPLFEYSKGEAEAAKTLGKNAARMIKNKPFIDLE